ncbi:uncharacterized protein Tco025E_04350 [Trypanosoma conorhini]|uniref:Uncharacterized protein n=1 Tax=Trypanosoma conorhini TaxID=83891 RepID=A0A3R7LQT0_9TRYP|nr:uncharacterized protein Tco025E_04350 [Trypanosoma conorhini]RNF18959.1 hypothetical protein Tco025E_04350 [Trypanosoma conorhini]
MRHALRLWQWKDLLLQWRMYLHGTQALTRRAALQLLRKTVDEAHVAAAGSGRSPLAKKSHSVLIWKALARQEAQWADCLSLMDAQWATLSPDQRRFLQNSLTCAESWRHLPSLMAEAWQPATELAAVYARLLVADTVVQFATLVHAALRERPQLGGVLPVTPQVLMRCYVLGRNQPEVALQCCRALALSDAKAVSRREKEALSFAYAMLHAKKGQWSVALSLLGSAREIRPSAKRLFWTYTSQASQWLRAIASLEPVGPRSVAEAIAHAPHWSYALRTLEKWDSPEAISAVLARPDCVDAMGWEASLRLCVAARVHSYSLIRSILTRVPPEQPRLMQLHAEAISAAGEAMYAGTLTRRAYKFAQAGGWAEAIGLLCGCRYYDVALPLAPYAPRGFALPHSLLKYEEAVHRSKISTTAAAAAASFEEQLAVALHGDWTKLTELHENARLRALMLARRLPSRGAAAAPQEEADEAAEKHAVQCFTFQSAELSRLVCCAAEVKAQRYFMQVIPRALRQHHFGAAQPPASEPCPSRRYAAFRSSAEAVVSRREACNALCAMVVEHLRAAGTLTGEAFLREVARCLASGKVQLAPADRHALPLAVLRAANYFHRLDATTTSRITLSTPSQHLMSHPEAVERGVNALVLAGHWRRAIALLERTSRPYPESFAVVAYGAPSSVAMKALNVLRKDHARSHWVLLLQDLLQGDVRSAQDELILSSFRAQSHFDEKQLLWRRRVLGACSALLHSADSMQHLVRAANISAFCALDVDEHGLQRLLPLLSWNQALTALTDLMERGEVVEEHWSLLVCTKPFIPLEAVRKIASWFPYSVLLHSVLVQQHAIVRGDLVTAVKALARYHALVVAEYKRSPTYLRPFVAFLKSVLQHFDDEAWRKARVWPVVRRVFNQMVEDAKFVHLGRQGRKSIPFSLREDAPLAALLVVGFLYSQLSRALQVPVPAAIVSRLLRSAALHTRDAWGALYFFKSLNKPNDDERALLVFALRDCEDAMTLLLNTGRFIRPRPEQVLVWSDPGLGGGRWLEAMALLSQTPVPQERLARLCATWTWEESLRALKLLQRTHGDSAAVKPYVALLTAAKKQNLKSG